MVEKVRMLDGELRLALRKLEANFGADRIRFLVHDAEGRGFNFCGVAKVEGAEGHVDGVAGHVAECAGAEVLPAAPVERLVNSIVNIRIMAAYVRPHRSRSNPKIPR